MSKKSTKLAKKAVLISYTPKKFFVLSVLVFALAITIIIMQQTQNTQQYAAKMCIDRPTCLDAKPYACVIPEPAQGWCPKPATKIVLPSSQK